MTLPCDNNSPPDYKIWNRKNVLTFHLHLLPECLKDAVCLIRIKEEGRRDFQLAGFPGQQPEGTCLAGQSPDTAVTGGCGGDFIEMARLPSRL